MQTHTQNSTFSQASFGSAIESRAFASGGYRFGFNGMEKDNKIKGCGNSLDYGARIYDSRLGRFLSIDPAFMYFSNESNYIFAGNAPVKFIDYKGYFKYPAGEVAKNKQDYPMLTKYLETQILHDVTNSPRIMQGLMKYGKLTEQQIKNALTWGKNSSVQVSISNLGNSTGLCLAGQAVCWRDGETSLFYLNDDFVKQMENANEEDKHSALLSLVSTVLHEFVHIGDFNYRETCLQDEPRFLDGIPYDVGAQFEYYVWGVDIGNSSPQVNNYTNESEKTCNFDVYIKDAKSVIENSKNNTDKTDTIPTLN